MRINKWIFDVVRMKIARLNKSEVTRLDCAERTTNFSQSFFEDFLDKLNQEDFITYPSYAEYGQLEHKISEYLGFNPENISLGTGSDACIKDLIQVTCNQDSEILSMSPCFPMYFVYGDTFGTGFKKVPYEDFEETGMSAFIDRITDKTSLVIFTNPGSPFGYYKTPQEVEVLAKACKEKGIILLIDEAYAEFAPGDCLDLVHDYNNVLVSRTFSKAWGAAGARVGFVVGSQNLIETISKVKLTYPITGASVKFVSHLLDNAEEIEDYALQSIRDRDELCDLLEENGYDVVRSHSNTIHFHESYGDNSKTIEILDKHNVSFKCGGRKTGTSVSVPGDERTSWIRLSIGPMIQYTDFVREIIEL